MNKNQINLLAKLIVAKIIGDAIGSTHRGFCEYEPIMQIGSDSKYPDGLYANLVIAVEGVKDDILGKHIEFATIDEMIAYIKNDTKV